MKISIGFECETQHCSTILWDTRRTIQASDILRMVPLTTDLTLYGDRFKSTTTLAKKTIEPFRSLLSQKEIYHIVLNCTYIIPRDAFADDLFTHAELIITFAELQDIDRDDVMTFILRSLGRALDRLVGSMDRTSLYKTAKISTIDKQEAT